MKCAYPVIFTQTESNVLIEVPDLEIFTEAENLIDAIFMARDAIGMKGISMEDMGKEIPKASDAATVEIEKSEFYEKGKTVLSLVDIDFSEYRKRNDNKMVRRNVTLPNWMNQAAEKEHLNVSKVLQEALQERLQTVK